MAGKTFYVAATLHRIEEATEVAEALLQLGMHRTYAWYATTSDRYREVAEHEIEAVIKADIFVGLLSYSMGFNTETGAALACKYQDSSRRILLYSGNPDEFCYFESVSKRSNIFWAHPFIEYVSGEDAATAIRSYLIKE